MFPPSSVYWRSGSRKKRPLARRRSKGWKPLRLTLCQVAEMRLRVDGTRADGALGHGTLRVDGGHRAVELRMFPLTAEALHHLGLPAHSGIEPPCGEYMESKSVERGLRIEDGMRRLLVRTGTVCQLVTMSAAPRMNLTSELSRRKMSNDEGPCHLRTLDNHTEQLWLGTRRRWLCVSPAKVLLTKCHHSASGRVPRANRRPAIAMPQI